MNSFVHLHGHSEYSALDGGSTIGEIINRVKILEQPAIALTEHGNVDSAFKFYHMAKQNNIKPILGSEMYFAYDGMGNKGKSGHIVILCKNYKGWQNLLKMTKLASMDGFYYTPRIDMELLKKYHEGLIVLTGCLGGIIPRLLIRDNLEEATNILNQLKSIFGDDLYLELQNHNTPEDITTMKLLIQLGINCDVSIIATNDFHYAKQEDAIVQDLLMCEGMKKMYKAPERKKMYKDYFYIQSREEMHASVLSLLNSIGDITDYNRKIEFANSIIDQSIKISDKCNVELPPYEVMLPKIENAAEKFDKLIQKGKEKYAHLFENGAYELRLIEEQSIITKAGLIEYFLIVHDFIDYAKKNNIIVGPGRGSVGGCLIGFLLGIHMLDPIKYNLMFNRFYNQGRIGSLPDIDIDFGSKDIKHILSYIEEKYGYDRVAHIGVLSTYAPRGAFKAICRIMQVPYGEANEMVNSIDKKSKNLKEALNESSSLLDRYTYEKIFYAGDLTFKDLYDYAMKIEGHISHKGIHAAGIVISPVDMNEVLPLRKEKKSNLLVSCWDMNDIEKSGLVKYDFLKIDILDAIKEAMSYDYVPYQSLEDIPIDDGSPECLKAYELISNTNNVGIFQLSGSMGVDIANKLNPQCMEDIAVAIALNRPGCINLGLHTQYVDRKNGVEPASNPYPLFDDILVDTQNLMIYQEQIIQMCMKIGFNEQEADKVRKIMGKKKPEMLAKIKPDFFAKALSTTTLKENEIEDLWDHIIKASAYLFNKSHSVGYSFISYYTAFMKANYPIEYMCALLNTSINDTDKLNIYLEECRTLKIEILPPSVVQGSDKFSIHDNKIIYGLLGIKGLGTEITKLLSEHTDFKNISDFCNKTKITKGYLEILIKAGALDNFGYNRNTLLCNVETIINAIANRKKHSKKKATPLFSYGLHINITQFKELKEEQLSQMEYEMLNVYLQYDPIEKYREWIKENVPNHDNLTDNDETMIAGYIQNYEIKKTKKGTDYMVLFLYSPKKVWKVFVFSYDLSAFKNCINDYKLVWIKGKYRQGSINGKKIGPI